jgi:hypothetical protein
MLCEIDPGRLDRLQLRSYLRILDRAHVQAGDKLRNLCSAHPEHVGQPIASEPLQLHTKLAAVKREPIDPLHDLVESLTGPNGSHEVGIFQWPVQQRITSFHR